MHEFVNRRAVKPCPAFLPSPKLRVSSRKKDDEWIPFLRGGYSEDGAALLDGSVSVGFGRYFDNSSNLLGFGVGWGSPAENGLKDQVTTELFYRLQLAQNLAITPDIQVIFNPALNSDQDAIAVFGIRTRLNF